MNKISTGPVRAPFPDMSFALVRVEPVASIPDRPPFAFSAVWERAATGNISALHDLLLAHAHRLRVRVVWEKTIRGARGWANFRTREVHVLTGTSERHLATLAPELGHIVHHDTEGRCSRCGPSHVRDQRELDAWRCLACEEAAWRYGMGLCPFSPEMRTAMKASLIYIRRTWHATPAARSAVDALTGTLADARARHVSAGWRTCCAGSDSDSR